MNSVSTKLPTKYGEFIITVYPAEKGLEPVVLATPEIDTTKPVLVRIHDECMTGDTFGSFKCDCGDQKEKALMMIADSKNGVFIYTRQEGRGIGLYEKIKAYELQNNGYDTHGANIQLGHKPDERDYLVTKEILDNLGIKQIRLITNNPSKVSQISKLGIEVVERIPIVVEANAHNKKYIEAKQIKFGHFSDSNNNYYFIGVNGIENIAQVKDIAKFIEDKNKNPLLEIYISNDTLDFNSLSDEKILSQTEQIFEAVYDSDGLKPVLHYSFKHSADPLADLKTIKEKMPYVKHIQLDDLKDNYIEVLKLALKNYVVIFPLSDYNFDQLLNNEEFIELVIKQGVQIVLDNSWGRGIRESSEKYKENILKCLDKGINNIALAGGFSPDYLDGYFEMSDYFKINFSIDAASGLFTDGKFDVEKAKKYIVNASAGKYL